MSSDQWPIKVRLIDVSGYEKSFVCHRCEQACKNKKKWWLQHFPIFFKCQTLFLEEAKTPFVKGHKPMPIHIFFLEPNFVTTLLSIRRFWWKRGKNLLSPSKKTVISTSGHLANWMANSLFKIESSSLLDPHSEARIITFTLHDPWNVCEVDAIFRFHSSSCQISKNIQTR